MEITINKKKCLCEKGEYLLTVAQRNGFKIPTLCHHPGLSAQGCCRLCIVEVLENGRSKVVVSCVYPLERSCEIYTNSEKIKEERSVILMLLKTRAPESKEIKELCETYQAFETDRLQPEVGEKCILCGLCIKACEALGSGAISSINRGITKKVDTPYHLPSANCIGCTSCAEVCPTGAIKWHQDKEHRFIWNRGFELVKCEQCRKIINTREALVHAKKMAETETVFLCDQCKKIKMADVLAHTYGIK